MQPLNPGGQPSTVKAQSSAQASVPSVRRQKAGARPSPPAVKIRRPRKANYLISRISDESDDPKPNDGDEAERSRCVPDWARAVWLNFPRLSGRHTPWGWRGREKRADELIKKKRHTSGFRGPCGRQQKQTPKACTSVLTRSPGLTLAAWSPRLCDHSLEVNGCRVCSRPYPSTHSERWRWWWQITAETCDQISSLFNNNYQCPLHYSWDKLFFISCCVELISDRSVCVSSRRCRCGCCL